MLITVPNPAKDQALTLTLDISELLEVDKISNHTFYSKIATWKSISIEYINPLNNQKKLVPIDYTQGELSVDKEFSFSEHYVGESALFHRIVVYDLGNGHLVIDRDDVVGAEDLDITFPTEE